jgi:uncharacterized protein
MNMALKKVFGRSLELDWKIAVVVIVSTLALIIDSYHAEIAPWLKIFPHWNTALISTKVLDRTILYFVLPMLITLFMFRENPARYGFGLGDWKAGLLITLASIILIAPILWLVSHGKGAMEEYYKPFLGGLPWNTFLDLFGWEFFFRGWILFGLARKFGPEAIWMQAIPFALAHIGKPEVETLSTIFGGFAFGWVAWRTKSFLYPFLIHWFVASFTILVAAGLLG